MLLKQVNIFLRLQLPNAMEIIEVRSSDFELQIEFGKVPQSYLAALDGTQRPNN